MRYQILGLFLLLAACDGGRRVPTPSGNGGNHPDASAGRDVEASDSGAGLRDTGGLDGAEGLDAAPAVDAAGFDAGSSLDAFVALDATTPPYDAGMVAPDASAPVDAGPSDSGVPPLLVCLQACTSPADCAQNAPGYTADHYRCDGACHWLGCASDADCANVPNTTCALTPGTSLRTCQKRCGSPVDCSAGTVAYDADNYACPSGLCVYTGCNSDSECQTGLNDPAMRCGRLPGYTYAVCLKGCSASSDCSLAQAGAAYDADNYRCTSGLCEYRGCNSTAECQSSFMSTQYLCHAP
ncbi:MAG: hypothetical protein U1E65_22495 [Myxococcota bacterium]